jgi:hypothetical protein
MVHYFDDTVVDIILNLRIELLLSVLLTISNICMALDENRMRGAAAVRFETFIFFSTTHPSLSSYHH